MLFVSYGFLSVLLFLSGFLGLAWFFVPIVAAIATIPYFFIQQKEGKLISRAQDNPRWIWILIVFISQCLVFGLAYGLGLAAG